MTADRAGQEIWAEGTAERGIERGAECAAERGGERGAGSVLGVTIMATLLCLTAMLVPLYAVLVVKQSVAGAADAAALAAADVRSGLEPGEPCAVATRVAAANGAELAACAIDGLVVTVTARGRFAGFTVGVSATAGPPGTGEYTGVE